MKRISGFLLVLLGLLLPHLLPGQCDPSFSVSSLILCPGDSVFFASLAPPGSIAAFSWDLGDLSTATGSNVAHVYTTNGLASSFPVILTVTDTLGSSCSDTTLLQVAPVTALAISVQADTKCSLGPQDTLFSTLFVLDTNQTPLSLGPFEWDFGDGTVAIFQTDSVFHTYNCFGTFEVRVRSLSATCPGYTHKIRFYTDPIAILQITGQAFVCEGQAILANNLSNSSQCGNIDYFIWNWGPYGVVDTVYDFSSQSHTYSLNNNVACNPALPFTGLSSSITLTAVNACATHFSGSQILIRPKPVAVFTAPDTLCLPNVNLLTVNQTCPSGFYIDPATYQWNFDDPLSGAANTSTFMNPSHTYSQPGLYNVSLIATNSCGADTVQNPLVVSGPPTSLIQGSDSVGCAPFTVSLSGLGSLGANEHHWEVSPGGGWNYVSPYTANSAQTVITFQNAATYKVILTTSNSCGLSTDTLTFTVLPAVVAPSIYNLYQGLPQQNIFRDCSNTPTFTLDLFPNPGSSMNLPTGVDSFTVDWGDGLVQTGLLALPNAHTYATQGVFDLQIIAHGSNGCQDTAFYIVANQSNPGVGIATLGGGLQECAPAPITLTLTGYPFNAPGTTYTWDFGDGSPLTIWPSQYPGTVTDTITHTFVTSSCGLPGNQFIITVSAGNYCDTATAAVYTYATIYTAAQADFIANPVAGGCGDSVRYCFTNTTTPGTSLSCALYANYRWDFGDGTSFVTNSGLNNGNVCHTFAAPGTYTVTLKGFNDVMSCDTAIHTETISVSPGPSLTANPSLAGAPCFNDTIQLHGTATGGTPGYTYQWSPAGLVSAPNSANPLALGITQSTIFSLIVTDALGCADTALLPVIPNPQLLLDLGPDTLLCYGDSLTLSPVVSGGTWPYSSSQWSPTTFLSASNVFSPTVQGITQTMTYVYTVGDNANCQIRDTLVIQVNPQLTVDAVGDTLCSSQPTSLQSFVAGGNGAYSYQWTPATFLNASNIANPTVTGLLSTNTYTLVVTDGMACSDSAQATVFLPAPPQAAFTLAATCLSPACVNEVITLMDASQNPPGGSPIVLWEWDLDNDGVIDAVGDTVSISYPTAGTYALKLIITNLAGCQDSTVQTVTVIAPPTASFSVQPASACAPLNPTLQENSSGIIQQYFWEIYGLNATGTPIPFFTSNAVLPPSLPTFAQGSTGDTTYYISLTVSNCCGSSTYVDSVTVFPQPIVDFATSQDSGCTPVVIDFLLEGLVTMNGIDSLVFNWGDGSGPQTVFPNPSGAPYTWDTLTHVFIGNGLADTTYQVTLYGWTPCGVDSLTHPIYVKPNDVQAFFSASNVDACEDLTVQVIDYAVGDSIMVSWCFDFDSVNQLCNQPIVFGLNDTLTYTYTQPGDYLIAQFVNNGCSYDTAYYNVIVRPQPVADFQFTSLCLGDTTQFLNLSTINNTVNAQGASIAGFFWDFGGLGTSFLENPSFLFSTAGPNDVRLIVTSDHNCQDTLTQTLQISHLPLASFRVDTACFGNQTQLRDNSSSLDGSITHWLIDWGNGQDSILNAPFPNPLPYLYTSPGNYTLSLRVTDSNGCQDSTGQIVTVLSLPQADFVADTVCEGTQTLFQDQSQPSGPGDPIVAWAWDFGAGNGSTVQHPVYQFPQAGQFSVQLRVRDHWGCQDSILQVIVVDSLPLVGFSADPACLGSPTQFTDLSQGAGSPIVSWLWDFGNGNAAVVQHPSVTYQSAGKKEVGLTVTDFRGCSQTVVDSVPVYVRPNAAFSLADTGRCQPLSLNFFDLSTGDTTITGWHWDFGDGDTSTLQNPGHQYANVGFYTVGLTATDANGCTDTSSRPLPIIFSHPEAHFSRSATQVCPGTLVQFTDLTLADTTTRSWFWDFGNGQTALQPNPSIQYHQPGIYTVSLVVENVLGCRDTFTVYNALEVYTPPVADFSIRDSTVCRPFQLANQITENASPGSAPLLDWYWDFGDGRNSHAQVPDHLYAERGRFPLSLVVLDANQCRDTARVVIHVKAPVADFVMTDDLPCLPGGITFEDHSVYEGSAGWRWDFGDGTRTSGISNPTHSYDENGTYRVKMVIQDYEGCRDSVEKNVNAFEFPFDLAEEIVRVTVDPVSHEHIMVEWDSIRHPKAKLVVIEKSSDYGLTYDKIYSKPVGFTAERRFIDRDAYVDSRPYLYRLYTEDTCGYRSPYSNLGKSIYLTKSRTANGVLLNWTKYHDWQYGVLQYDLEVGYVDKASQQFAYHYLESFSAADTSYEHLFLDSVQYLAGGDLQYRIKAHELYNRDTVSYSNQVLITGSPNIFVPSAFSPNQDDVNDLFVVNGGEIPWADHYEIHIYNRWGRELFTSTSVREQDSWRGTDKDGIPVPEGVFVFRIQVLGINGKEYNMSGTLTLIR